MSIQYQAIGWNRQKRIYDLVMGAAALLYLGIFVGVGALAFPDATAETLLIRGFGTMALLLLHVVLCIGPLSRLDKRFLPILYNRRHLGVMMFFAALVHGGFSIFQFHALGDISPLVSLFTTNTRYGSLSGFPFEPLGFFALLILFVMAATSHDFWLHTLSAGVWKRIHMSVYLAYGLIVAHVVLGALQSEGNLALAIALGSGLLLLCSLHLLTGYREKRADRTPAPAAQDGFLAVCAVDGIAENCGTVVKAAGERIAVFRYDGKVSAVSNVCRHQNGPLGEGRIIDGCITCPWHGYQYLPESGASPAPYTDQVSTFRTRITNGIVYVDPTPLPPGTPVEPSRIEACS